MNLWAERTVALVREQDYLDRLQEIYPHVDQERDVDPRMLDLIRRSFDAGNDTVLLNTLLDLGKFPYKDSYVAFLRDDRTAIERNPATVRRVCDRLRGMGVEVVIAGATAAKEANTMRGPSFAVWARAHFRFVDPEEFKRSSRGIVMLESNERDARDICNREMGVGIDKRPDMVAKSGRKYVIGEAKFLSSLGGNQDRGFDDGMTLATNTHGTAFKVFLLDGVYWIHPGAQQTQRIAYGNTAVFSALLLQEFLAAVPQ